jgi:hypothetical protein
VQFDHVDPSAIADKLEALRGDLGSLLVLAFQLGNEVKAALAAIKPAPVRAGIDPDQQAGPLAVELWQTLGRRKALIVRTRLSQLAEAEDGHRQPNGNGRDLVARPNGDGGNGHVAL